MASCLKCGAEIPAGAPACTVCGTPQAAAAAYPAQVAVAPPAKQGSNTVKIILIIVVIFIGLGILGLGAVGFVAWRTAHAIRAAVNGDKVALNLPGGAGSFSASDSEHFTASDLGTDIYPGATAGKGGMRMTLPTGTMTQAMYLTADSKDQVVAFYKNKFGTDNVTAFDTPDGSVITYAKNQGETIVVTVISNQSQYEGKTQIQIVHTVSTKSS